MAFDPELCKGCPIEGEHRPWEPDYIDEARFMVVVDPISKPGVKEDRAMPPATHKMFLKHMKTEGFEDDDFNYHPICLCPYDQNEYTNKEKKTIHKHCRQHMVSAIKEYKPDAIISLGAEPTSQVVGRSVKITKVRGLGQQTDEFRQMLMPMLHPGQAVRYPENEPFLASDAAALGRLVAAGFDARKAGDVRAGDYKVVTDLQFLIDMKPELLAFDTETTGLSWFRGGVDVRGYKRALHEGKSFFKPKFQILCMSFTVDENTSYVLPWDMPGHSIPEKDRPKLRNQLRKLLCREETLVVGHNLKFDNVALWMTEGIRFRIGGDSLMLAAVYDENAMNKDLASMVKIHCPEMAAYSDWFDAKYNKERMWEVPWNDMIPYVGGDTIAAYRLYLTLERKVMEDDGDWNHYCRVSIPGLNAFSAIETRGMFVDDERALPEFQQFLSQKVEEQRQSLLAQVPREIKRQHVADPRFKNDPAAALAFSRQDFLRDILFTHPKGFRLKPVVWTKTTANLPERMRVASTSSKDHLPYFFDECPFTMELAEYVKNERLLSTNIIGFRNKYVVDGKVRPNYSLSKTVTRRTSSDNPNGQNFPKRGQMAMTYRKMFVAPPGYYVLEVDLSQAELRIAGDMAGDPTIIKIYQTGGDIHITTACVVLGVSEAQFKQMPKDKQKEWRTKAKAINFGFIYGMGWRKFIGYAKTQYGVEFTENESKRIRAAFFKKYSRLPLWHERMRALAAKNKYVRSYSGLRRHLPMIDSPEEGIQAEAGRQAINSPVQEFGSSLGVMALGRMNDEIDPQYFQFVGFVHDAIVAYVKCEYLDWGLKTLKGYMESNPLKDWFGRTMKAPILAEAGFGLNLGEIYELPDFSLDRPYDFANSEHLKDKEGKMLIAVPAQKRPPNDGRILRSPYTLPTDLEPENVEVVERRRRMVRVSPAVPKAKQPMRRVTRTADTAPARPSRIIRRTRVSQDSRSSTR